MANEAGLVIQGDDEANILAAHADYVDDPEGAYYKIYNVIYGAGGDDELKVVNDNRLQNVGVELYGEDGNDTLWDSKGKDTLSGGIGDDAIHQSAGNDVIDGGEGIDTLFIRFSLNQLAISNVEKLVLANEIIKVAGVDLNVFQDIASNGHTGLRFSFVQQTSYALDNLNEGIAYVYILGSAYDDVFDGSMSRARFDIDGKAGNDTLTAGLGKALLEGGLGNDILRGSGADDKLFGGSGDDLIYGGDGADRIEAGAGNDTVYGGAGNDRISGKGLPGDEKLLFGGAGNDTFDNWSPKSMENVVLSGGAGRDSIEISGDISKIGIKGFESLRFIDEITADADVLDQFDRIVGSYIDQYPTTLKFSSGGEFTWKSASSVQWGRLLGSREADIIDMRKATQDWEVHTGAGNDVVRLGGKAYSSVYADSGNDVLYAGQNGSELVSGSGNDTLVGGHGSDALDFRFGGNDTLIVGRNSGRDDVYSFDADGPSQDVIDLSAIRAIKNFDDLVKNHLSGSAGVTIDLGGNNRLYIYGVGELQESSFIF